MFNIGFQKQLTEIPQDDYLKPKKSLLHIIPFGSDCVKTKHIFKTMNAGKRTGRNHKRLSAILRWHTS